MICHLFLFKSCYCFFKQWLARHVHCDVRKECRTAPCSPQASAQKRMQIAVISSLSEAVFWPLGWSSAFLPSKRQWLHQTRRLGKPCPPEQPDMLALSPEWPTWVREEPGEEGEGPSLDENMYMVGVGGLRVQSPCSRKGKWWRGGTGGRKQDAICCGFLCRFQISFLPINLSRQQKYLKVRVGGQSDRFSVVVFWLQGPTGWSIWIHHMSTYNPCLNR